MVSFAGLLRCQVRLRSYICEYKCSSNAIDVNLLDSWPIGVLVLDFTSWQRVRVVNHVRTINYRFIRLHLSIVLLRASPDVRTGTTRRVLRGDRSWIENN
jgi:hypothetical protein